MPVQTSLKTCTHSNDVYIKPFADTFLHHPNEICDLSECPEGEEISTS